MPRSRVTRVAPCRRDVTASIIAAVTRHRYHGRVGERDASASCCHCEPTRIKIRQGAIESALTRQGSRGRLTGEEPRERPVHIFDVLATIYRQLGVPTDTHFRDQLGRPFPVLAEGTPIAELL